MKKMKNEEKNYKRKMNKALYISGVFHTQQPRNCICTPLPTDWVVIVLTTFVSFPKVIFVAANGGRGEGIGVGWRK